MSGPIDAVLTELIWVLGGGLLALVGTVASLLRATREGPVNPALGAAGVALLALATALGALAGTYNPDVHTGVVAAALLRVVGLLALLPIAGAALLGWAFFGAQPTPRRWLAPAAMAAVAVGCAALIAVEGHVGGNPLFGYVRAALALGAGALTAIAAAGAGDRTASSAGLSFALVVAMLEGAERGMVAFFALHVAAGVQPANRAAAVDGMLAAVSAEVAWGAASVGLASAAAMALILRDALTDPARRGDLLGLLWLPVVAAALLLGVPDRDTLVAAAEAAPTLASP